MWMAILNYILELHKDNEDRPSSARWSASVFGLASLFFASQAFFWSFFGKALVVNFSFGLATFFGSISAGIYGAAQIRGGLHGMFAFKNPPPAPTPPPPNLTPTQPPRLP